MSIQAQYALLQMQQKGYILQEDNSLASRLDIFCHHLNIAPTVAHQGLRSTKVAVKALGSVAAEDLIAVLESLQIQVADEGDWTTIPEKCPSLL
ncbi:MAG: hypothetical protein V7K77_27050 [Nostoc sp.]|uniref:hypothetical protein n=2 Tax=unclassified Nostoc TaxID=2593658 RepID=UPI002FFA18AF